MSGITYVKATSILYQENENFDPFVMPKWAIQVFYIKVKFHTRWLLVHEVDAQAQPVIYIFKIERKTEALVHASFDV